MQHHSSSPNTTKPVQTPQTPEDTNALLAARDEINTIDTTLVELLKQRLDCAERIAAYKRAHKLPILDSAREREHLYALYAISPKEHTEEFQTIFELIMELSRNHQAGRKSETPAMLQHIINAQHETANVFPHVARVALQGAEGAYQQLAADKLFNHAQLTYYPHFEDVFDAVEKGECEYGIVPLENSTAGSVTQVFDLMRKHAFSIARTTRLKIDHTLLAKKELPLDEITHIYSHPQALSQCTNFLQTMPHAEIHRVKNTAIAAQMVATSQDTHVAAIASASCADLYKLKVLKVDIQDSDNNYTRFACITKTLEIYPGADRTSLMLTAAHQPGSLYKILRCFYALGINIIKLESRPIVGHDFEFMFYFDIKCPVVAPEFDGLIRALLNVCSDVRYLGSYTEVI